MSNLPDRALLEQYLGADVLAARPHLFSEAEVVLPRETFAQLAAFVRAVTELVGQPLYQSAVAARQRSHTPTPAPIAAMPPGVCLGFDFHVGAEHPQLIEVNTNAGGALLVTLLERAWANPVAAERAETALLQMFKAEWAAWASGRDLRCIAIVDEAPEQQYLYPEFLRWQALFEAAGIRAVICAPDALHCDAMGRLWQGDAGIDLVYNRLTDFSLSAEVCAPIHQAWARQDSGDTGGTLITPHPQAHALWADKRNLQWLSDAQALQSFGLPTEAVAAITPCVPLTVPVTIDAADAFWATRKQWFFKPQAGFGSRATYRGDKLTKRVFEEILQGGYVAQRYAPPPEISVIDRQTGENRLLKYDLRAYAYAGEIQLLAARLYQGQTTNFRTVGGGFAPVRLA